eukprot:scaffold91076_cov48-Phaeocystis_antarctica.AAC.1
MLAPGWTLQPLMTAWRSSATFHGGPRVRDLGLDVVRADVWVGRDDGACGEVDALPHHVRAEEAALALDELLDAGRLGEGLGAARAALAAVDEAGHRLAQLVPGHQQLLVGRDLAPAHAHDRRRLSTARGVAQLEQLRVGGEDLAEPDVLRMLEETVAHLVA